MITSRAAILTAPGKPFVVDAIEVASPRPGEVLVEIAASGLCHTDLTAIQGRTRVVSTRQSWATRAQGAWSRSALRCVAYRSATT